MALRGGARTFCFLVSLFLWFVLSPWFSWVASFLLFFVFSFYFTRFVQGSGSTEVQRPALLQDLPMVVFPLVFISPFLIVLSSGDRFFLLLFSLDFSAHVFGGDSNGFRT